MYWTYVKSAVFIVQTTISGDSYVELNSSRCIDKHSGVGLSVSEVIIIS